MGKVKKKKFEIPIWAFFVLLGICLIALFFSYYKAGFFDNFNNLIRGNKIVPDETNHFLGTLSIDDWSFFIVTGCFKESWYQETYGNYTNVTNVVGWTTMRKDIYILSGQYFSYTHHICCHEICHNYINNLEETDYSLSISQRFLNNTGLNMSTRQALEEEICENYADNCEEPVCDKLIVMLRGYQK